MGILLIGVSLLWAIVFILLWISHVKQRRKFEEELERYQNGLIDMINTINEKEKEWFD